MTDKKDSADHGTSEPTASQTSDADKIWDHIKSRTVDAFALKQKVSELCEYRPIDPQRCFLILKASAALPAIEAAINDEYEISLMDKYAVVEKKKRAF